MKSLEINCDGGSRGNPGPAASAFVVYEDGKEIVRGKKFLGTATNNVAEYTALGLALTWLTKNRKKFDGNIDFYLDSELVVKQLTGKYKVKNKTLQKYVSRIKSLEEELGADVFYNHVRREKNKIADELVNEALDSAI